MHAHMSVCVCAYAGTLVHLLVLSVNFRSLCASSAAAFHMLHSADLMRNAQLFAHTHTRTQILTSGGVGGMHSHGNWHTLSSFDK